MIVLATLNAKYIHASLGLRYLLANMGDLRPQTVLREFTIARSAQDIVAELLSGAEPISIIGLGVYIWNVRQTEAVIRCLKAVRPDITVILGGPEVSHEVDEQAITQLADYVITGWGDISFAKICRALLSGTPPGGKIIVGEQPPLQQIKFPYREYSDADLAHRLLYVEASRGCPFKCEFCLSALDKTAWAFDLDPFLDEMADLYQRGARNFKFVDRTFNLKVDFSVRILQFFLDRLPKGGGSEATNLFIHFEIVPDHLPELLKAMIVQFPPDVLQFEVGVQSFNPEVQQRISRKQNNEKTEANLIWLVEHSTAHLHADLIFGLPGETLESFAAGFDRLYRLGPHEIQLGILKRLRGTPIRRHTAEHHMIYDAEPPYLVQKTDVIDVGTMQQFSRFARYWDMIANSGRFKQTLPVLLGSQAFAEFMKFSDWLWQSTQKTNGLTPEHLVDALFKYLTQNRAKPVEDVQRVLLADYLASGARSNPVALQGLLPKRGPAIREKRALTQRQVQHRASRAKLD